MKKLILLLAFFLSVMALPTATAQNVNISININSQPAWGPVGYDYVAYYYFPDIDCYYDVNNGMFYYYRRGGWVASRYLPYAYQSYDLYSLYKVVINVPNPWHNHVYYRNHYAHFRGNRTQVVILNSRDNRYAASRQNRVNWTKPQQTNNTNGRVTNTRTQTGRTNNAATNNNRPAAETRSNTRQNSDANTGRTSITTERNNNNRQVQSTPANTNRNNGNTNARSTGSSPSRSTSGRAQ